MEGEGQRRSFLFTMANTAKAGIEFVDNVGRRTWDKDEYKRKAEERVALQGEDGSSRPRIAKEVVQRAPLKARETLVNLESRLGKTQVQVDRLASDIFGYRG